MDGGSWTTYSDDLISTGRFKSGGVVLPDGRLWLSGGEGGSTSSSEYLETDGTVTTGPDLLVSRKEHCTVLRSDGKVMVLGGGGSLHMKVSHKFGKTSKKTRK